MFESIASTALEWGRQVLAVAVVLTAIVGGLFFFWRKAREEHFEEWIATDALFQASLAMLIGSRLGHLILHWGQVPFSFMSLVNIWSYPGLWLPTGLLAWVLVLMRFAHREKLDTWEVWDFSTLTLTWTLAWLAVAQLLWGSGAGITTTLPWGILFPGRVEPAHPVALYRAVLFFVLFAYLWRVEPRYRFFMWYRSKNRTARTGYLTSVALIGLGLIETLLSFVQYPLWPVWGVDLQIVVSGLIFFFGCALLYLRSGLYGSSKR